MFDTGMTAATSYLTMAASLALVGCGASSGDGPKDVDTSRPSSWWGVYYDCTDDDIETDLEALCSEMSLRGWRAGADKARVCSVNVGTVGPVVSCARCAAQGDYQEVIYRCWGEALEAGFLDEDPDCPLLEELLEGFFGSYYECEPAE